MQKLVSGVSFGQQAQHDPSLAFEKHSFSLIQECESLVFQSFFPQKKKSDVHVLLAVS